jgi:hypothetical protein
VPLPRQPACLRAGIGLFCGIFVGSVVLGLLLGLIASLIFRSGFLYDMRTRASDAGGSTLEMGMFVVFAYGACKRAHVDQLLSMLRAAATRRPWHERRRGNRLPSRTLVAPRLTWSLCALTYAPQAPTCWVTSCA